MAKATERYAVFHLWFHPADPASVFENELLRVIQYIDSQGKQGLVWVATLSEIAAYCEAREGLRPAVERNEGEMRVVWRGAFQGEKYGHTELSLVFPILSRPRMVTMTKGDGFRHLELGRSYVQTAAGRLLINMLATAESLRIVL
jgi:hypothetical protein